jgi:recombination protein RecR
MTVLERLVLQLSRLPGIGRKSASRIAYFILKSDQEFADRLANDIMDLKRRIRQCSVCGNFTEDDPCGICTDPRRDQSLVCVVEQSEDVLTIEQTNEYSGLFHVLTGVISPLDGVGPGDLTIGKLMDRIRRGGVTEVIIATNPTVEGDATAMYLLRLLADTNVNVSRLASGLPVGGDLEYADKLTLARSIKSRISLS